ncbi:ATP-dependent DNA helicase PIF1 [Lamellibrachia satsuma]|nr:ATP-dependent DNA helicase PIF1 [Lamellibrachia satsuma]
MELDSGELACTVAHELLAPSGETLKRTVHQKGSVCLGRNEFRDIILKVKLGNKEIKLPLKDVVVFRKFAKEGKATLRLSKQNVQFMLSNCPPNKIMTLLKTLAAKLECRKLEKPGVSERQKLLSERPRSFQEISPITIKDMQTLQRTRTQAADKSTKTVTLSGKRKRVSDENNKENQPPKMMRQANTAGSAASVSATHSLNVDQRKVFRAVLSGQNIFFTGSAGTGKSFLLKKIIGSLPPEHTCATASTGVAACHIGGITLHAFAGIGSGKAPLDQCQQLAARPVVTRNWKKCKHLIIDEVSMVDGDFFDKMEAIARYKFAGICRELEWAVRKTDEPFGGIQLILCGDFFQLPPVTASGDKRKFAFQSRAWRHCINLNMELKDVKRQSDKRFIDILQNIRVGRCPEPVYECLMATSRHSIDKDGIVATRLCTHKEDVDQINSLHLRRLVGESHIFDAIDSDPGMSDRISVLCPVKPHLDLKEGAQVMLAKNLGVHRGLVNGARGVVVGFEPGTKGLPKVRFLCGITMTVRPERWAFKTSGSIYLTRTQLPLKLAWAISIHKSQGMSLDCVEISLARVFECGQAYVALSRARNLEGLRIVDFNKSCVRANPDVIKFYRQMELSAMQQQSTLGPYMT